MSWVPHLNICTVTLHRGCVQALKQLQQAQHEMATARAEAEASRKLVESEASQLESRAASVQAEAAVATEQRLSMTAKLRELDQREVTNGDRGVD